MQTTVHNFYRETLSFLSDAVDHYEKTAPTVSKHCDDLYIRLSSARHGMATLSEIGQVAGLRDGEGWLPPNLAANRIYHIRHELGMDTTGNAGF